jgi:2-polyprenyl-3-methyl-5-hydroxy-6-metoxy-1,4-benzoquinol methylase
MIPSSEGMRDYRYRNSKASAAHAYLLPALERIFAAERPARVFEVGCGNGWVAAWMHDRGIAVQAIDFSENGIARAREAHPDVGFAIGSAYDDLAAQYGRYPVVLSLEVVEHLYDPRQFMRRCFDLVEPGGRLLISTPYHGYLKNLALALSGKLDEHFTALWDGGHIKFWSMRTLRVLIEEAGFEELRFERVGRIPSLAKSMLAMARKPAI